MGISPSSVARSADSPCHSPSSMAVGMAVLRICCWAHSGRKSVSLRPKRRGSLIPRSSRPAGLMYRISPSAVTVTTASSVASRMVLRGAPVLAGFFLKVELEVELLRLVAREYVPESFHRAMGHALGKDLAELASEGGLGVQEERHVPRRLVAQDHAVAVDAKDGVADGAVQCRDLVVVLLAP